MSEKHEAVNSDLVVLAIDGMKAGLEICRERGLISGFKFEDSCDGDERSVCFSIGVIRHVDYLRVDISKAGE